MRTLDELEQIAKAAKSAHPQSGRWFTVDPPWGHGDVVVAGNPDPHLGAVVADCQMVDEDGGDELSAPDACAIAAHVAAASPDTILEFVARIRVLSAEITAMAEGHAAFVSALVETHEAEIAELQRRLGAAKSDETP